ncbi:MAG: rhodanese-like domain-containing protein [Burkholderiales bacterium]|nr:rhodanese-like domain-containing protein [Burkholderiales bacterium]
MKHLTPKEAFAFLAANPAALLVDCRSEIEYFYVGHPTGAIHIAWHEAPDWTVNPEFAEEVLREAGERDRPIVLICRSGKRTLDAGAELERAGFAEVINVLHGFEGDLDEDFHRGTRNGWRHDGLPWEQL